MEKKFEYKKEPPHNVVTSKSLDFGLTFGGRVHKVMALFILAIIKSRGSLRCSTGRQSRVIYTAIYTGTNASLDRFNLTEFNT